MWAQLCYGIIARMQGKGRRPLCLVSGGHWPLRTLRPRVMGRPGVVGPDRAARGSPDPSADRRPGSGDGAAATDPSKPPITLALPGNTPTPPAVAGDQGARVAGHAHTSRTSAYGRQAFRRVGPGSRWGRRSSASSSPRTTSSLPISSSRAWLAVRQFASVTALTSSACAWPYARQGSSAAGPPSSPPGHAPLCPTPASGSWLTTWSWPMTRRPRWGRRRPAAGAGPRAAARRPQAPNRHAPSRSGPGRRPVGAREPNSSV
jgi:hypothetical protein